MIICKTVSEIETNAMALATNKQFKSGMEFNVTPEVMAQLFATYDSNSTVIHHYRYYTCVGVVHLVPQVPKYVKSELWKVINSL